MFGGLYVVLAERFLGESEGREVQVLRLVQQSVLYALIVAVYSDLLQDQRYNQQLKPWFYL